MASAERRGFVRDTVTDALVTTHDDALAADNGTLPARQEVIAGYDGVNTQVVKTSAAGLLQVDVLSSPAAGAVALDAATLAALESITAVGPLTNAELRAAVVPTQDSRLPAALGAGGGVKVEGVAGGVAQPVSGTVTANAGTGPFPISDNAGSITVDAAAASFAVNKAQVAGTAVSVNSGVKDAGTQRVILASDQTVVPVSDNAGSLTVDAPVGTPVFVRLSDGAAAVAPLTDTQLRASVVPVQLPPATLAVTGTAAAGTGVTATLAAVAGQFHYITGIRIVKIASVATVGAAAPTVITTTNLPGALAWSLPTALAVGTQWEVYETFAQPLKSSVVNTNTTIVAAGLASIIYRITVYYYTAA